jgi:hypothetical protein
VFAGSPELWQSLHEVKVRGVELVGPSVCHEEDVEAAVWAATLAPHGTPAAQTQLLAKLIIQPTESVTTFITSNYVVRLEDSVREVAIGPVRIRSTTISARKFRSTERAWLLQSAKVRMQ